MTLGLPWVWTSLDAVAAVAMLRCMQDKPPSPPRVPRPGKKPDRIEREAAALRANLRKRKEQAREREMERRPAKQD